MVLNNSGSIAVDDGVTSAAVRFNDSSGGSILSVSNNATGIISGNTHGMAFNLVKGATANITNRGAISGDIVSAVSNFALQNFGNATVNSNITLTDGAAVISANDNAVINSNLTLSNTSTAIGINDSAQFNGNITGGTSNLDIIINGVLAKINGDINLGTNSSSSVAMTNGAIDGDFTFGNTAQVLTLNGTAQVHGAIIGTGNINIGETASLTLDSGTLTSLINGTTANAGSLLIGNSQTVLAGANIGSSRSLGTVSLQSGSTLSLNSGGNRSLSAENIYLDSGSTLNVGTAAVNGTIRGISNGVGTVNFAGNNSLNNDVGVSGFALANINLASGVTLNAASHNIMATNLTLKSASTLTTSGDVVANVSLANGSNLNLGNGAVLGLSGNTVDSAVTAGFGTITTTSGTVTVNSDIGQTRAISAFNVGSGSTAAVVNNIAANTISIAGNMDLQAFGGNILTGNVSGTGTGTLSLNQASHSLVGTLNLAANDTLSTTIFDNVTAGNITVSGAAMNDSGMLLKVALGSATTEVGSTYTLIYGGTGSALTAVPDSNINVDNTGTNHIGKYAFNSSVSGNNFILTVSRYAVPEIYQNPSMTNPYNAIIGDDVSTTGELAQLRDYLDSNGPSDAQKADALKSALLENDNSRSRNIFDNINLAAGLIGNRLSSIRSPGRSSGDDGIRNAIWAEGFGLSANQASRGGYDGYAANTSGFGVGIDQTCDNGFTLGLAAIYAHTKIKSSYSAKKTDLDNYELNLYAGKAFDNFFINALIGVGFNQYDSERRIGIIPAVAQADYNGKSYIARAEIGSNMRFGNEFIFTPTLMLTAAKNTIESYSESGAGTLNIHVNNDNVNFFEARVGSALSKNFRISRDNILTPTIFAYYGYDFAGDRQKATANFVGQTATFANNAARIAQGSLRAGVGAKLYNVKDVSLSAEYSYDRRVGYNSHMGALRLRYNF